MTFTDHDLRVLAADDELVDGEAAEHLVRFADGSQPAADVRDALHAARRMGLRSVWCRGLWRFETGAGWGWRAMDAPGVPSRPRFTSTTETRNHR